MADQPELDWSGAGVSGGTLSVEVSGETDKDWAQTFSRTLALLSSGGGWGQVAFKKGTVTVEEVQEGAEDNLRFALDGAVQEANAHHAETSDEDGGDEDGAGDDADGDTAADETDRRMTDRFRDR